MVPSDSSGHPDMYGPGGSLTLKYQHGLRCQFTPWTSAQPSVATLATDINGDTGCYRAMGPDTALSSNQGWNITMDPGSSSSLLEWPGPFLWTLTWSQVVAKS